MPMTPPPPGRASPEPAPAGSAAEADVAAAVQACAAAIARGELVAFPTETVYGLGARADDDAAVARIFAAKGRPPEHPLIVHVASPDAVGEFAHEVSPAARRLMQQFWPGPLTLILPRRPGRGDAASGGQRSIGLRLPSHPLAQALLQAAGRLGVPGVAAPSANRFGRISPTTAQHVLQEFGPALRVLDGGACAVGIESAIVDCTREPPALLRPGQLSRLQIEQALGQPLAAADAGSPRVPGSLASHYAPTAPLRLWDATTLHRELAARAATAADSPVRPGGPGTAGAKTIAVYSRVAPAPRASAEGQPGWVWQPMPTDADAVAHELFAVLRAFDAAGVDAIWVEAPPASPAWDGVRDRLQRAAHR